MKEDIMDSIFINIIEDGVFAAIAAIGFSSISNTPRRAYLMCGLIAAIGHSIRYVLMLPALGGMHIIAASTIASFVIGILAVLFAGRIKCPAEVCFFPALLPMIPGMYVKEYVVFHGERLVYEISDDKQGTSYVVESESLKSKAFNRKDRNRFEIINSMLVNQEMREDNELLETLDVYLNTVHLFEENLSIL